MCFIPQLVTKFKDGLVLRRPKNDKRDASTVAARLRVGEFPLSYVPGDFWQGLRRLTRYRFHLSRNLSREKMRFQAYAFLKCSDWKRVRPFTDLFGATSIALLTEYTVAELNQMSHDQLVDLIRRRGRGHFQDPTATARKVREVLRSSYPIAPQTDEMVTAALATAWAQSRIGAAGAGTLAEKPELTGAIIIMVAIPETMVILGFVVAAMILLML